MLVSLIVIENINRLVGLVYRDDNATYFEPETSARKRHLVEERCKFSLQEKLEKKTMLDKQATRQP